uniref:Uncharacterized protein n=1 Tax=Anguilla anguilla TaxID=7936 RepID=A0A0E9XI30_ANGAN
MVFISSLRMLYYMPVLISSVSQQGFLILISFCCYFYI